MRHPGIDAGEHVAPQDGLPLAPARGWLSTDRLALLGFAVPVAAYFWLIHHYGVNVVYLDQWSDAGIIRHSYSGTLTLGALWSQHSEQRLFFPNLIVLALTYTTHLNIVVEEYLSAVLLCVSSLLLIVSHKRRSPSRKWIFYCPAAIVMLSLVQSTSTLFGFQLAWYLLILMLAVTLFLLDRRSLSYAALGGAVVAAVVGSFSSLPGLFIWPAGLILLYHRRRPLGQVLAWCVAALASVVIYRIDFSTSAAAPSSLSGLHRPAQAIRSFFQLIGNVGGIQLTNANRAVNYVVLLFGIVLFLLAVYAVVTRGLRRDDVSGAPLGVALICFGLLYAVSFAYARGWAGPGTATAGQYTTFTLLIMVGTYLALLGPPVRPISVSPPKMNATRLVACVVAGALCLQVVLGTTNGLRIATKWHRNQIAAAVVLADVKQVPDPIMQTVLGSFFLQPALVRSYAETLRVHHLSLFGSPGFSSYRQQALAEARRGAFKYVAPTVVYVPGGSRTLKGNVIFDALGRVDQHAKRVELVLIVGSRDKNIGAATSTVDGWILHWKTTTVPNGSYRIESVAYSARGVMRSAPVPVVIHNP